MSMPVAVTASTRVEKAMILPAEARTDVDKSQMLDELAGWCRWPAARQKIRRIEFFAAIPISIKMPINTGSEIDVRVLRGTIRV
jgi:hypothetical protein